MMRSMEDEHKILSRCHGIVFLPVKTFYVLLMILKRKHLSPFFGIIITI